MDKRLKEKFAKWCSDYTQGAYNTTFSNDIDSLIGCAIEYEKKRNPINFYYDFNTIFVADKADTRKSIGIDIALVNGKCWDNHVVKIGQLDRVNPETANLNGIYNISTRNYLNKYAGSTALTMWSYYSLPLPKSEIGKMILLAIDGFYVGCYHDRFGSKQREYLRLMGFEDLINLLNKKNKNDFRNIIEDFNFTDKFKIDKRGYISTDMDLSRISELLELDISLPTQSFTKSVELEGHKKDIYNYKSTSSLKNPVSFALIGNTTFKYTSLRGK